MHSHRLISLPLRQFHLTFKYNHDDSRYECTDLGSRNGTLLNGRRMSNAKQESDALPLLHGAIIGLSQTRLLCHVHEGHSTCDECEPGLLQAVAAAAGSTGAIAAGGTTATGGAVGCGTAADGAADVAYLTHKQELKQLKKRYGLAEESELFLCCLSVVFERN